MMNPMEIPCGNGGILLLVSAAACDDNQSVTCSRRRINTRHHFPFPKGISNNDFRLGIFD